MSSDHESPTSSGLDTDIVPLGERMLQRVLDHVVAVGDEAETTYLEVKGPLEMGSTATAAKIAKFLLGVANRRPQEAVRHFHGHAVLVIGVQKDKALGVSRGTEAHELEDRLSRYLGPPFPAFEFGRIGVDPEHEVLFIIAQPPEAGQPIFPCHKSFHGDDSRDKLEDGAIYVRGASNTRHARSGEVLALVERSRGGGKPPIDLTVDVLGQINRADRVGDLLEGLYEFEEAEFTKPKPPANDWGSAMLAANAFRTQERLSPDERDERLAAWRNEKNEHIAQGRQHFLGVVLPGSGIRVVSGDRFVDRPELIITFHDCEVVDHLDLDDADYSKVVEPIVRQQFPFGTGFALDGFRVHSSEYPVVWGNRGDDAQIVITPDSFRPNVPWETDQDDYVILARDPQADTVLVSWVLTENGNDAPTTDSFEEPTGYLVDAISLYKAVFLEHS